MISGQQLSDEVLDLGKSIGLFSDDGNLDTTWFQNPLDHLESILTNQPDHSQRDALLSMLDALLPPVQLEGIPDGEKWHPLLGSTPRGNVYLTVKTDGANVLFGAAGDFNSTDAADPKASLRVHLPLVRGGASVSEVAGTQDGPLKVDFRIQLAWQRPAQTIGLDAVSISATISFLPSLSASLVVELEKLQLVDELPKNTILDPNELGTEAIHLIIGLIRQNLSQIAAPAGEVTAVVDHLLPLLGFGSDGIPPFPFDQIARGPAALQGWFSSLIQGAGTPPISAWLSHLIGLLGATDLTVSGAGTATDPWRARVLAFGPGNASSLDVTLASVTGPSSASLLFGFQAAVSPSVVAQATLASIPLAGTASAAVLPAAAVTMRAPGNSGAPALVSTGNITVGSLRAGLNWNGSNLQPLLELDNVTLLLAGTNTNYPRIDLTNADSVVANLSSSVTNAVVAALGNGAGRHLAVLAGLAPPAGDPGSPHAVDLAQLVTNPASAIAAVHRAVLLDSTHNWSFMLQEAAGLLGLAGGISGAGTETDPWRVALGTSGPISVYLGAWNAQQSGNAGDPQQLRLGLRLSAASAPVQFGWLAELLAFELPQSGAGSASLMAGQHASFVLQPIPPIPPAGGIGIAADSFSASMDWVPAGSMAWQAGINNISLTSGGTSVTLGSLSYPAAAGFDISNPVATAASLGVSVPNLELLLRSLLGRAALAWGGVPGFTLAGLFGVHGGLPGFQADWPVLADPAAPGSLLSDPFSALRQWLEHLAVDVSADGSAYLPAALNWLRSLLGNSLPATLPDPAGFTFDMPTTGSGTYEDPWALPLTSSADPAASALAWLEPAGPPPNWALSLVAEAAAAADLAGLLDVAQALAPFVPELRDALAGLDADTLAISLNGLAGYFAASDGVVPVLSQIPTGGSWTSGAPINSAHNQQTRDPSAISQILSQIDTWAGGVAGARAVLLLGPSFEAHTAWHDLLSSSSLHGTTDPAANFNLRLPGVDPATIDLNTVTAAVDYYTADLADDGSGNLSSLTNQISRIVGRIGQLRPGVKVTLVAHSTAGVPARAFTAANPPLVQGLITLGTPHLGAPLSFLTDPDMATAVRTLESLRKGLTAPTSVSDALDHIVQALDGYLPPETAGALPTPAPYPVASFNFSSVSPTDTGSRPALALGGPLSGSLLDTLKQALGNVANAIAHPGSPPPAPTHLGFGARARLSVPSPHPSEVQVDAWLRADLFRVKLRDGVADPPRPAHALGVRARVSLPGDWLVGAASSFAGLGAPPVDLRVRWAELGADIQSGTSGLQVTPHLALHQASYHGPSTSLVGFADAQAQALLGAVLHSIAASAPRVGSPVDVLLNALESIGVAVPDPHGGVGISSDAFTALATDPASFLAPRVQSALAGASGLLGIVGAGDGQWAMPLGSLPVQVYLSRSKQDSSWTAGLRTTPAAGTGLTLASNASLSFDGSLHLQDFKPTLDASFTLGALNLAWSSSQSQLRVQALPWLAPLTLVPKPDAATLKAALNDVLPRLLFSSVTSGLLGAVLGPGFQVGPIDSFFSAPGNSARNSPALCNGATLDSAKLTVLLQALNQAAGFPAGPGLALPGNLQITASGAGTDADPVSLMLSTTALIGGVASIQAGAAFDSLMHVTPKGSLTLSVKNLPATTAILPWTEVSLTFGASASGLSLSVTPQPGSPIQILPAFSGLADLAQNLEALLPRALDDLAGALSTPGPPPALLTAALQVASGLGLYDNAGKFAAHADKLKALTEGNWTTALGLSSATQGQIATAITGLFSGASPLSGMIPGTVSASAGTVTWSFALGGSDAGTLTVTFGWDGSGPTAALGIAAFKLGDGALIADLTAGYASGQVQCSTALAVSLASSLGIDVAPKFAASVSGGSFSVKLLPLASGGGDGPLAVNLAPSPSVHLDAGGATQVAENLLLPLVSDLVLKAAASELASPVWPGASKTVEDVLVSANLIVKGATPDKDTLKTPLPDIATLVTNVIAALASGASIQVTDTLTLTLADDGGQLGVRLSGNQDFNVGSFDLSMRFGAPSDWGSGTDHGVTLYLLQDGGSITFNPVLDVAGLGFGITGSSDSPLINTQEFRLGGLRGYVFFRSEFTGTLFADFGGGIELDGLGLPLGQATGGGVGGNPVAASLMKSDAGSGGDPHPVNPSVDLSAWYLQPPHGDSQFHIQIGGKPDQALWIPVHAGFGPIYIDQIGVQLDSSQPKPSASLLIDGSVKVDGLTAQADELGVTIPLRSIASPGDWSLDLKGLAVAFSAPGVAISGGLLKNDGPPIEYDGMLLIQISQFGFVAVGAYSTPSDAEGGYTSMFVFVGVFLVVGLPPVIEVDAFGLGVGYNRELLTPNDLNQIPSFVLVAALDDAGAFANDPMGELIQIRSSMPAKRGSFWLAVGLRGSSFVIVHVTAVVYVALDRGLEIGILGVAQMALPGDDTALVNIELALKARFSTAEGILSIQAQLTDNSWLLSKDCQLTGGFAYFMWFP